MKLVAILCLTICCFPGSTSANRAKDVLTLIADVVKSSPSDNRLIVMMERNTLEASASSALIKYSPKWTEVYITKAGLCKPKNPSSIPKFSATGKRATMSKKELLNMLNSAEGKAIVMKGVSGQRLSVPKAKFASAGVRMGSLPVMRSSAGRSGTTAAVLLQRVRNIVVNDEARELFVSALDDYTLRVALYNMCNCNPFAAKIFDFLAWIKRFAATIG